MKTQFARAPRVELGQPTSVGQLREMLLCFCDDAPLMARNAPLPTIYYTMIDGAGHIEIVIPNATRQEEA